MILVSPVRASRRANGRALARDYVEGGLDLDERLVERLVRNKPAAYFVRVEGGSMAEAFSPPTTRNPPAERLARSESPIRATEYIRLCPSIRKSTHNRNVLTHSCSVYVHFFE
jgi:hypothetical protein